jgi:hypothetical protein
VPQQPAQLPRLHSVPCPGFVCSNAPEARKIISLGHFRVHRARQDNDEATNLLERPDVTFITVPAHGSGRAVTVTHSLSSERLLAYAEKISSDDLQVGEIYNTKLIGGYTGALLWC